MTKKDAVDYWATEILPRVTEHFEKNGIKDKPARAESWSDYTNMLCKDGQITQTQFSLWHSPKQCD